MKKTESQLNHNLTMLSYSVVAHDSVQKDVSRY